MTVTVVVVDDEPLARKKLQDLIGSVDWLKLVGEAGDGPAAIASLERLEPDLVLLDYQLPGFDGMEVLRRSRHQPGVVFTTAFSQHAVAAFEANAIDYLLKPFDRARFLQAVTRARTVVETPDRGGQRERLKAAGDLARDVDRLFVRHAGRIVVVPFDQVEYLEARRDYVAVHAPPHRYVVHLTLGGLEKRLPASRFVRIHRSYIVNIRAMTELVPKGNAQLEAVLRSGMRLLASRTFSRGLRDLAI